MTASERDVYMRALTDTSTFSSMSGISFSNPRPGVGPPNARTNNVNPVGPSLDYTYQEIVSLAELPDREPSAGIRKRSQEDQGEQDGETEIKVVSSRDAAKQRNNASKQAERRLHSAGIKLAYNELKNLNGLEAALEAVMENPKETLTMIDLSHNQLTSIPQVLCEYKNLAVIYLHGNKILNIKEIEKLNYLDNLQKLTLNGNQRTDEKPDGGRRVRRLEDTRFYRPCTIFTLKDTMLKSLDSCPITPKDRENSLIWFKNHRKR